MTRRSHRALQAVLNGQSTTDSFTYRANDAHGGIGTATVTITLAGRAHRPPTLSAIESSTVQYTAGTAAVPVTSGLNISAPDDTTLTGTTVSISSGLVSSEDALGFVNQNGITGSYNSATGVLTLTGTSSVANYQAALRSVTFSDPNGTNPTTGPRTISFQVDDGASLNHLSNVVSRDVQVNPNSPPTAGDVSASTDKKTAIDIDVLASASDPDGDTLTVASVNTTGTKGLVSINPDGTIRYDPNGQFSGLQQGRTATDTFAYRVSDGFHDSNSATVTVTISGVNDPPVLSNIESSAIQYDAGTAPVQVTQHARDRQSARLHAGGGDGFDHEWAGGERGRPGLQRPERDHRRLRPEHRRAHADRGRVGGRLRDGPSVGHLQRSQRHRPHHWSAHHQLPGRRRASSNNLSNVVSRTVQVNPNPPPTAGNVSASTDKHTAIDINVLSSASDPDGDTLTVVSVNTTGTRARSASMLPVRSTTTPTASSTTSQRARQPPTRSPTRSATATTTPTAPP